MVFTDGSLDAAVEVASAQNGGSLKALSMMSAGGRYDAALRTRGETNEEFRAMLEVGTADALRMWVYGGHAIVSNVAIQVGIELWRHARLPLPAAGGLVFRNALFPDGAAEKWAASARDLARRVVDFSKDNDLQKCAYPQLRQLFSHCQWRLSRMCRMRANEAEVRKDTQASRLENDLADKLDESNEQWREVREKMNWVARQGGVRLSPREGLKLGLERADFRMAGAFAERVLKVDADDMQANFAMGMNFMTSRKYRLAEKHLKKCLLRSPNEPAVLNNLAVAQLRLKRYEEARTNALRALELYPDSPEIKETLRHINAAKNQSR
jgi:tetratricopeptide (TPR) repeat protein